jgi:hypothetical protein
VLNDIYIVYPHLDVDFAADLFGRLSANNYQCAFNDEAAIERSLVVLVIVSRHVYEDERVTRECAVAATCGRPIVVLTLDDCRFPWDLPGLSDPALVIERTGPWLRALVNMIREMMPPSGSSYFDVYYDYAEEDVEWMCAFFDDLVKPAATELLARPLYSRVNRSWEMKYASVFVIVLSPDYTGSEKKRADFEVCRSVIEERRNVEHRAAPAFVFEQRPLPQDHGLDVSWVQSPVQRGELAAPGTPAFTTWARTFAGELVAAIDIATLGSVQQGHWR